MAYNRLNLKTGDELNESVFKRIDDGIVTLHNDLYDDKKTGGELVEYFNTYSMSNSGGFSYSSTFAGWTGYVGTIKDITHVKFNFKVVSGYPVSMACIKFWEVPDKSALTPKADGRGYTPDINSWNLISTTVKSFEIVTDSTVWTEKTFELDTPIFDNAKQLVMGIDFNNIVTYPMLRLTSEQFPNDMPAFGVVTSSTRTPDYENLTEAMLKNATWNQTTGILDATAFNFDNPTSVVAPKCIIYNLEGATPYSEIGTQNEDKFSDLVKDVLDNSGVTDNLNLAVSMVTSNFEPVIENSYYKGPQNIDNSQLYSDGSMTSIFSGFFWGIGKVPADIMLTGFKTIVKCRNNAGDFTTCTKIWGYLYESDIAPNVPSSGTNRQLVVGTNTTQVRVVELDVNLDVASEEDAVIEVIFDTPYYNTEEKYLYIGYNMNVNAEHLGTYAYTSPVPTLQAIDGINYGTVYNYQTSSKTQLGKTTNLGNGWTNSHAEPWHLIRGEEKWYAAEGLREIINNATDNLDLTVPATAEICLPKKYDLVVGDTFQMFYRGVIKCFDVNAQGINVLCSIGSAYPRYFECTPTTAGEYSLTLQCRDIEGTIIASGTTTLVVHDIPTYDTEKNVTMMIFGDSLTQSGQWAAEGIRRLVGTDTSISPASLQIPNLTINTYGAIEKTVNTQTVFHEGYGGWSWTSFMATERTNSTVNGIYVTLSSAHGYNLNTVQKSIWVDNNGKKWELEDFPADNKIKFNRGEGNDATQANTSLPTSLSCSSLSLSLSSFTATWESGNPFYDVNSGKVDFAHHANKYGYESADIAACLLSWNLGGGTSDGSFDFTERIETIIEEQAKPLIRQLHSDMPNTKLIVMGLQLNSITGGMAANYGAAGGYSDAWGAMMFAFDYDKALEDMCNDSEFKSYCYYVDTKGQFDTEYMMPWEEHPVNTRLTTKKEIRGLNGVHPSGNGYNQIGDAFFRKLVAVLNDIQ